MKCKISKISICSGGLIILTCSISGVALTNDFLPSEAIAQPWLLASGTNYGLGLPTTATTGGGTRLVNPEKPAPALDDRLDDKSTIIPPNTHRRSAPRSVPPRVRRPILLQKMELPLLTLLTPSDGARTASPQPTFYWYLHDQKNLSSSTSDADPKHVFTGQLRVMTEDKEPTTIFQINLKMHCGLSSFKLPIAVSLDPSKTYRWQITFQDPQKQEVIASGLIVYTPPEDSLQKSLMQALTLRDRAKIYAEAGYWFEAIDGYTRWLKLSPNDLKARTARNEILKLGFITNKNLDFDSFIGLLNADAPKPLANPSR